MRIPVAGFSLDAIFPEQEWRINLYRCDGPGNDSVRRFPPWCPKYNENFHVPASFDRLILSREQK